MLLCFIQYLDTLQGVRRRLLLFFVSTILLDGCYAVVSLFLALGALETAGVAFRVGLVILYSRTAVGVSREG